MGGEGGSVGRNRNGGGEECLSSSSSSSGGALAGRVTEATH